MALATARATRSARRPRPAATSHSGPPTLQSMKSAQTRARLMDATIRCLVKYGYANTTTPLVAAEVGLSRGAMLHHFENGAALIKATIAELHEKRLRAFRRTAEITAHDTREMVEQYWKQLQKPAFVAFHELALAARTNGDLGEIMRPLQTEFRERYHAEAVQLFPEWDYDPEGLDIAMTMSQTTMEGLAISLMTGAIDEASVGPMLDLLVQQIDMFKERARQRRDTAKR